MSLSNDSFTTQMVARCHEILRRTAAMTVVSRSEVATLNLNVLEHIRVHKFTQKEVKSVIKYCFDMLLLFDGAKT